MPMTVEPETMHGPLKALTIALNYLTKRPSEFTLPEDILREELIARISKLTASGEENPIVLAELAIDQMRKHFADSNKPG